MDEHPSPWIAAVAREEARKLMAEHEHTHHGNAMGELREELRAAAEGLIERDRLGPPKPVPEWLRPLRTPLGPGDLRLAPSTEELRVIATLLDHERLAGQALVTMRDGSPWLEVDVVVPHHVVASDAQHALGRQPMQPAPEPGVYRYAIWRYSAKPYRIGPDGAVEDDPLW